MEQLASALAGLAELSAKISSRLPSDEAQVRELWSTYSNEAAWGRRYLVSELRRLPHGAAILEVGAGVMALSGELAMEGYSVTAVEPVGIGFDSIGYLGGLVLNELEEQGVHLNRLPVRAEELTAEEAYDFAFSINVLEHVSDVEGVLDRVIAGLRPGGRLRFQCPNYSFPYEPHFGWIVPPRKVLADRVCRSFVETSTIPDAQELWDSLNWVSVRRIRAWSQTRDDVELVLNPNALHDIWLRAKSDPVLMERHRGLLTRAVEHADRRGFADLLRVVPTAVQPVIDGLVIKHA